MVLKTEYRNKFLKPESVVPFSSSWREGRGKGQPLNRLWCFSQDLGASSLPLLHEAGDKVGAILAKSSKMLLRVNKI